MPYKIQQKFKVVILILSNTLFNLGRPYPSPKRDLQNIGNFTIVPLNWKWKPYYNPIGFSRTWVQSN